MDLRRVQKVSTQTYVVSLPKKWAVKHQVGPGTIVAMEESASGSLVVRPGDGRVPQRVPRITDPETLEESLIAAYLLGAQEVVVAATTPELRARTLTAMQELNGMDVVEESSATLRLRCLIDEETIRLQTLLDRMCVLLTYAVQLSVVGSENAVQQNEREINKAYHLCQRLLTRAAHDPAFLESTGVPSARAILAYQLLVKRLEHVGDALKELPPGLPAKSRATVDTLVRLVCAMVRALTAGKRDAQLPSRDTLLKLRRDATVPQILFLARTAQDVREEIILLRMGEQLRGD